MGTPKPRTMNETIWDQHAVRARGENEALLYGDYNVVQAGPVDRDGSDPPQQGSCMSWRPSGAGAQRLSAAGCARTWRRGARGLPRRASRWRLEETRSVDARREASSPRSPRGADAGRRGHPRASSGTGRCCSRAEHSQREGRGRCTNYIRRH